MACSGWCYVANHAPTLDQILTFAEMKAELKVGLGREDLQLALPRPTHLERNMSDPLPNRQSKAKRRIAR